MSSNSSEYRPRSPADAALYQVVRDHLETFRARAASLRDGEGLPRFVERAFCDFLRCGWLAGGFARFRCAACGLDRLVAFSCKGRGLCPSCGGRRMAERATHLVDRVFPDVPIRQWVLSLPHRLRYVLAWDHDVCRAVAGVLARAVFRVLRERASDAGITGGRGGGVIVIQRFGGALNLNVHLHALILDGVFAPAPDGRMSFQPLARLTTLDVEEVLATIEPLVARLLERRGLGAGDDGSGASDGWLDDAPVLAGLAAASVQGLPVLAAATRPARPGSAPQWAELREPGPCHARANGFSLHAALVVPAGQRERLQQICRYVLRPPVAADRLQVTAEGQVRVTLRQPWRDGTTAIVFDPVEFLGRLAVLIPRPRINLLLYFGVLGARARGRTEVVGLTGAAGAVGEDPLSERAGPAITECASPGGRARARGQQWAALMRRTFGFDVLACPRCGGRLRLIALIDQAAVIARVIGRLGVPTEVPPPRPARPPPEMTRVDPTDGWDQVVVP